LAVEAKLLQHGRNPNGHAIERLAMNELRFDGKVAIVTGSGRNLGREYALLLAARGARIVVNDFGVGISDTDGRAEAPAQNPAHDVVDEIRASGGEAIANTDTVASSEGGAAIVQSALDAFGGVDVVVNNAGQVRMAPFATFPDELIDPVIDTQLRGVLNVSRPAWKFMAEHGGGRFVNVASGAAFGGVPGGAVYGMAKMGVIGLTRAMASEGKPDGIAANVIVPSAKTRAGTGFGPIPWSDELADWLHPRLVAPLVGWLAHPDCPLSGECLSVGGGHFARVGLVTNDGILDRDATIETLAERADDLTGGATTPMESAGGAMAAMFRDYPGPR
jgi:NAD(P)-dependent dehydrogenase (short-subunit alcohol dehydrogenase family)